MLIFHILTVSQVENKLDEHFYHTLHISILNENSDDQHQT